MNGLPEMDSFMWINNTTDAFNMVFKSQKFMFKDGFIDSKLKELQDEKLNKIVQNDSKVN